MSSRMAYLGAVSAGGFMHMSHGNAWIYDMDDGWSLFLYTYI